MLKIGDWINFQVCYPNDYAQVLSTEESANHIVYHLMYYRKLSKLKKFPGKIGYDKKMKAWRYFDRHMFGGGDWEATICVPEVIAPINADIPEISLFRSEESNREDY